MVKRNCIKCTKPIGRKNSSGYCNHCRDRTGANNPFFGKKHKQESIDQAKEKLSSISKQKWLDPEYRQKVITNVSKPRREGFKQEQSERIAEWYTTNPEQLAIRSEAMKASWAAHKIKPNNRKSKIEIKFITALKERCPDLECDEIITLSDNTQVVPDGFFPYLGIVIEFYGNYFHANPDMYKPEDPVLGTVAQAIWDRDEKRKMALEYEGYYVHVVWEKEFKKNPNNVLQELDNFINWDACSF